MKGNVVTLTSNNRETILKIAKEQNIKIKSFCKRGICGRCLVKVIDGNVSRPTEKEIKKIGQSGIKEGYRLACQTQFSGRLKLEV
ncbi:2Fe-2S iron-sulfur cluster-binding protein [Vallitalea okinawensis]|uniref:2Fe-2S iron-sulfur cluster-binding protein n=1 Tax=Vallitalea okinawensis TaxID=2078660 RepID=UPI000CFC23D6|nr:2Fe-2S iron-sulfur cluster-binding protein [Vallitalea okinawensis]